VAVELRIVSVGYFALGYVYPKGGLWFYGQGVGRDVGNTEVGGDAEVLCPHLIGGGLPAVDEVDADVVETRPVYFFYGGSGFLRIMSAVHETKIFLEERLDADAEAVYRRIGQGLDGGFVEVVGVGF